MSIFTFLNHPLDGLFAMPFCSRVTSTFLFQTFLPLFIKIYHTLVIVQHIMLYVNAKQHYMLYNAQSYDL